MEFFLNIKVVTTPVLQFHFKDIFGLQMYTLVTLAHMRKRVTVTLCPGESTGLSCAVYEEKGGCHPLSWGEYRTVLSAVYEEKVGCHTVSWGEYRAAL